MAKTIKIEGTFEVINPNDKTCEGKFVLRDSTDFECVTTLHPVKVPGNSINFEIGLGGVSLAKRIFFRTTEQLTLKFNAITEDGFNVGAGDMILMNEDGVTAIFVTTGPTETEITAVIAGDC